MSEEKHMIRLAQAVAEGYSSRATLYRYIRQGLLPAQRRGNAFFVAREDLDALRDDVPVSPADCARHLRVEVTRALPHLTSQDRQSIAAQLWPPKSA